MRMLQELETGGAADQTANPFLCGFFLLVHLRYRLNCNNQNRVAPSNHIEVENCFPQSFDVHVAVLMLLFE